MGAFCVYILKAALCLTLFYLFYRLLLSKETFHRFNRIGILCILLLSLLVPFCKVTIHQETEITQTVLSLEQLLMQANYTDSSQTLPEQTASFAWIQVLMIVYFLGVLFFIGRNLYSLVRVLLLIKGGKKEQIEKGVTLIIHHKENLSPFSWMNYVVISEKDLEESAREILIHELAHIKNRHSLDLLLTEVSTFFQWFNPAIWLLKQELQNIHEYEADETVIKEGVNAKQYQLLLIKKAVGTRLYSMANSFNHSKLKKRITMMLKEKSSPWARLKYLYVLPVAAIAITAFARPEISNELQEISTVKVNDFASIMETKKQDTIVINNNERAIILGKSGEIDKEKLPLFVVDGKEISVDDALLLNTSKIQSITLLKDLKSTEPYGAKGKNGVISIELIKKDNTEKERPAFLVDMKQLIEAAQDVSESDMARRFPATKTQKGAPLTVKGFVVNTNGDPIHGATIFIKGTDIATMTGADGRYELKTTDDALLQVSHVGMKDQELKPKKKLNIMMEKQ
ncbi:M56 family metallopeptidase [Bacteroides sp. 224]|uniref:M56 family metallopeptidase n=1 Tax=Bacteroides sp. 224 TaxID=2302936 RepID=UPI0013D06E6F|nr:M56 family metallopeptidase [Bacteroides sp. 224]NDV65958.1 M56 family peptidase [Bacteroides sp. 224]